MTEHRARPRLPAASHRLDPPGVLVVGDYGRHYGGYQDVLRHPEFDIYGYLATLQDIAQQADRLHSMSQVISVVAVHGLVGVVTGSASEEHTLNVPMQIHRVMPNADAHIIYLPMSDPIDYGRLMEHGFDGVVHPATPQEEIIAAKALMHALLGGTLERDHAKNYTILQVPSDPRSATVPAVAEVPLRAVPAQGTDPDKPTWH